MIRGETKSLALTTLEYKDAAKRCGLTLKAIRGHDDDGTYYHGFECGRFGVVLNEGKIVGEAYVYHAGTFFEPPDIDACYTGDEFDTWQAAIDWLVREAHEQQLNDALLVANECRTMARAYRDDVVDPH